MKYALIAVALLLAGCKTTEVVTREVPVEVLVAVSTPCMGERPVEILPLRDQYTFAEWGALSTDQREALLGAQAMRRLGYGEKLTGAAAGCR